MVLLNQCFSVGSGVKEANVLEGSQKESLQPQFKKNIPVIIAEPATLYLWDLEAERFRLQGEVEASIVENGPRDCTLFTTDVIDCDQPFFLSSLVTS